MFVFFHRLIPKLISLLTIDRKSLQMTLEILKISKIAALVLENLIATPGADKFFEPYERDLFFVASTDS